MCILIKITAEHILKIKTIMHYFQIIIIFDGSILGSLLLEYISRNKKKRAILTDDLLLDYI